MAAFRGARRFNGLIAYLASMEQIMAEVNTGVNPFWGEFGKVLTEKGIDDNHLKFYLNWAQKFAVWLKGVPLRERSLADIRSFVGRVGTGQL